MIQAFRGHRIWRAKSAKIVTYNIQLGLGKDGRFDPQGIASEVNGADVIALQGSNAIGTVAVMPINLRGSDRYWIVTIGSPMPLG